MTNEKATPKANQVRPMATPSYGEGKDLCAVCGCIIENGRTYCPQHEPGADDP
jgi:hypothetical protein